MRTGSEGKPPVPEPVYVVIPAHNEGRVVGSVVQRVRESLPGAAVVVVDDGSRDDTGERAAAAGARVVTLPFNCGYGVALLTGLTAVFRAGAPTVVTMDADGQHDPASLGAILKPVCDGEADLVLGSRYLPGSVSYPVPLLRRVVSWGLSWFLTLFAGQRLTDTTTGFQCMNRATLGLFVTLRDFPEKAPDADLILYAVMAGARVREVPVTMHMDQGGDSMHGAIKSMFYVPKLATAVLSVRLEYAHLKLRVRRPR
jgi:glycosyltransferase involved in cell wall biosynthesis